MSHESISVQNSKPMPSVGLGYWKVPKSDAAQLTVDAIQAGYRHLDCAADYGNEPEVGEGIADALSRGLCRREDLWVTSKLWNTYHRPEHVRGALKKTLTDLKLDFLDLYLVHFPIALRHVPIEKRYPPGWFFDTKGDDHRMIGDSVPIRDTWQAMEELVREGLVRSIGISNFGVSLIRDLLTTCRIRPTVLQVESHPYLVQPKLLRYCQAESIAYTAFSPLGAPSYIPLGMAQPADSVLEQASVQAIAAKHGRTPAQVVLRWGIQRGTAIVPKTNRIERLKENLSIFYFELSESEMATIQGLDRNQRFNDPGVFCESSFGCFYPIYE